jgi:predicted nucleic acid-binding protein
VRILFDTNVVLDLLLDRAPFANAAAGLAAMAERGELVGVLGATTVTTVHYLAAKALDDQRARSHVKKLLQIFEVAPVTRSVLESALGLPFRDFEDAVLHEAGREFGATAIVTRNQPDFDGGSLAIYEPAELYVALTSVQENGS